jgi:hypothetical protein
MRRSRVVVPPRAGARAEFIEIFVKGYPGSRNPLSVLYIPLIESVRGM